MPAHAHYTEAQSDTDALFHRLLAASDSAAPQIARQLGAAIVAERRAAYELRCESRDMAFRGGIVEGRAA